jgi:hypothetical protein
MYTKKNPTLLLKRYTICGKLRKLEGLDGQEEMRTNDMQIRNKRESRFCSLKGFARKTNSFPLFYFKS